MGERHIRIVEVEGSNPFISTIYGVSILLSQVNIVLGVMQYAAPRKNYVRSVEI